MKFLFSLKFCGHRRLENGKVIIRFMEISDKVVTYMTQSNGQKICPAKGERFPLLLNNTKPIIFPANFVFSLSACRDTEPILKLFQSEKTLTVFLYSRLRELIAALLERFWDQT